MLNELSTPFPHALWFPVIVLALQHGLTAGLLASIVATALHFSGGLPPEIISEDLYSYIGRIGAEPIGWTVVALVIGHLRSRQIAQAAELRAELADQIKESTAVAGLCMDLKGRSDILERHIASHALSSHIDVAEAITGLRDANATTFSSRLSQFITLMTGSSDFAIYLLRESTLNLVFNPSDANRKDLYIEPDSLLFHAVVQERRTLSAAKPRDREVIEERAAIVGPLIENSPSARVIGMLAIGTGDLIDFPEDIERRFALTCSEVSRLLDRMILIETATPAPAPVVRPISRLERLHSAAQRESVARMNQASAG
jgi:hypothetical protein